MTWLILTPVALILVVLYLALRYPDDRCPAVYDGYRCERGLGHSGSWHTAVLAESDAEVHRMRWREEPAVSASAGR